MWNTPVETPPHPSFVNASARQLYEKMAAISQTYLCAGWIRDNEYDLWQAIHSETHEYGFSALKPAHVGELRDLAVLAQGWIWTGPEKQFEPRLVSFDVWHSILAERARASASRAADAV